jgi:hypothetical protein
MTTVLSPAAKQQFFDNNGRPLVGGKLFVYEAATTTKATTYTSSTGLTPNTNPIILDYRGECSLWVDPNVGYKYVLALATDTDPPGSPIWSVDHVTSSQLITLYGGVDTGSPNAYVLNFTANFDSYVDGTVIFWIPSNTNTGLAVTINVNGLGPVAITNQDGSILRAGQLVVNQVAQIMYRGTGFVLLVSGLAASLQEGSWNPAWTGFAALSAPVGVMDWQITGRVATLEWAGAQGTSDATTMTITNVPAEVMPNISVGDPTIATVLIDNGLRVLGCVGFSGGSTLTFFAGVNPSGFTAGGNKGPPFAWTITYPLG